MRYLLAFVFLLLVCMTVLLFYATVPYFAMAPTFNRIAIIIVDICGLSIVVITGITIFSSWKEFND